MPATSTTIQFCVRCDSTQWGESVGVLGSFNQWDKAAVVPLATSENDYPKWSASVTVDITLNHIEYKYVIVKDSHIARWETDSTHNRRLQLSRESANKVSDHFGRVHIEHASSNGHHQDLMYFKSTNDHAHFDVTPSLDALEAALVETTNKHKSWRQRLQFIRQLFTDADVQKTTEFNASSPSLAHLSTIAVYLQFLSTGYIACAEDGGHHRPNHHAHEAQILDARLAALTRDGGDDSRAPFIVRKILPFLPSYSAQFLVSVPLTRIRDIAHRNDIPKDLKLDIKHNLQNKLHRCAGPEDLHTSKRILDLISHGGYSQPFVEQFHIFHDELKHFFNRASVDERLDFLAGTGMASAGDLLRMKRENANAFYQLEQVVKVRMELARTAFADTGDDVDGDVQKMRLADIEIESYTFLLLAALAKEAEEQDASDMSRIIHVISLAMHSIHFNGIQRAETQCIFDELDSIVDGEIELIRLHAATERCVRFVTAFSDTVYKTLDSRARSIGPAFRLEPRVIDVLAEAEIRASIVFQTSRLVSTLSARLKRDLDLPLWNALCTGMIVADHVEYVHALSDARLTKRSIVVCETCDGDEEVAEHVVGVITAVPIPQLSHLGVRVRQAGVVFACAEQRSAFDNSVWKPSRRISGKCILKVNDSEGLADFRAFDATKDATLATESASLDQAEKSKLSTLSMSVDEDFRTVIPDVRDATKDRVSSKAFVAGTLLCIADDSDGLFKACEAAALPHGIFQSEIDRNKVSYRKLVFAYHESRSEEDRGKIQALIHERFQVSPDDISALKAAAGGRKVMVRSSANAEDIETLSGAGLYDTIANVDASDSDALTDAIKTVWASVWTERAASSRLRYDVKDNVVSMAVLVQVMVRSDLSFVAFSRDPVQNKSDAVYVELVVGMGETLASAAGGAGSPYRFRIDRTSLDVTPVAMASYSHALLPGDGKDGGLVQSSINYSNVRLTTDHEWRNDVVKRIARTVLLLEKELEAPQDVEGCVLVDKDELYIVQSRPQIL